MKGKPSDSFRCLRLRDNVVYFREGIFMITPTEHPLSPDQMSKIDLILESHDYDPTQIVGILLEVQDLEPLH